MYCIDDVELLLLNAYSFVSPLHTYMPFLIHAHVYPVLFCGLHPPTACAHTSIQFARQTKFLNEEKWKTITAINGCCSNLNFMCNAESEAQANI